MTKTMSSSFKYSMLILLKVSIMRNGSHEVFTIRVKLNQLKYIFFQYSMLILSKVHIMRNGSHEVLTIRINLIF